MGNGLNAKQQFESCHPIEEGVIALSFALENSTNASKWTYGKAIFDYKEYILKYPNVETFS